MVSENYNKALLPLFALTTSITVCHVRQQGGSAARGIAKLRGAHDFLGVGRYVCPALDEHLPTVATTRHGAAMRARAGNHLPPNT